jgi:hypothetical protein
MTIAPELGDLRVGRLIGRVLVTSTYSASISRMAQRTKVTGEPGTYYRALSAGYSPEQDPAARNYVALIAGFRSTLKLRGTPNRGAWVTELRLSLCAPRDPAVRLIPGPPAV